MNKQNNYKNVKKKGNKILYLMSRKIRLHTFWIQVSLFNQTTSLIASLAHPKTLPTRHKQHKTPLFQQSPTWKLGGNKSLIHGGLGVKTFRSHMLFNSLLLTIGQRSRKTHVGSVREPLWKQLNSLALIVYSTSCFNKRSVKAIKDSEMWWYDIWYMTWSHGMASEKHNLRSFHAI